MQQRQGIGYTDIAEVRTVIGAAACNQLLADGWVGSLSFNNSCGDDIRRRAAETGYTALLRGLCGNISIYSIVRRERTKAYGRETC
jgi:hypothetical protein